MHREVPVRFGEGRWETYELTLFTMFFRKAPSAYSIKDEEICGVQWMYCMDNGNIHRI